MTVIAFLVAAALASPTPDVVISPPVLVPIVPPPPITIRGTQDWPTARPSYIVSSPNWADYRNYPTAAVQKDEEGQVLFRLLIDVSGTPIDCVVVASSGSAALDGGTCALARQMRFSPARDAGGKAVPSSHFSRVTWLLDDARPFASSWLDAELIFEGGVLVGCTAEGGGPYLQPWKQVVCRDAKRYPEKFAARGGLPRKAMLAVRVDAGDGGLAQRQWPQGMVIASDQASFAIDSEGDATDCSAEVDGDIFSNDYRSQSSCGHFLSVIWFEQPDDSGAKRAPRRGLYELRVIVPE